MKSKLVISLLVICLICMLGCSKTFVCSDGTTAKDASTCNAAPPVQTGADTSSQETTPAEPTSDESVSTTDPTATPQTIKEVKPTLLLSKSQKDKLAELLANKKVAVIPSAMGVDERISIGGTYTFAFAIKNTDVQEQTFKISIKLAEARSESFSKLGADDTTASWFLPHTKLDQEYVLAKNEIAYIPLVLVVGDKMNKDGDATFEGTYKFKVTAETVEGPFTREYSYVEFTSRISND